MKVYFRKVSERFVQYRVWVVKYRIIDDVFGLHEPKTEYLVCPAAHQEQNAISRVLAKIPKTKWVDFQILSVELAPNESWPEEIKSRLTELELPE